MRTTLTLDPDVAEALANEQHRSHGTFKEVVNTALRRGLALASKPAVGRPRFEVEAHHCGFRPGIDVGRLNQLLDELDVDDFIDRKGRPEQR